MADLRIRIEGPGAKATTEALEEFFAAEFGVTPRREPSAPDREGTRTDPVALAAFVLAFPGAVLATVQLADRLELKPRLERLKALARGRSASPEDRVLLEAPDGKSVALDEADIPEIIAIAERAATADET